MAQFSSRLYPQTNPTNPILLAYRNRPDLSAWMFLFVQYDALGINLMWEHPEHRFHAFASSNGAQRRHARRVIERLASLSG